MSGKYYAVRQGRTPGVYETWIETKVQVDFYPSAEYKRFNNLKDAQAYLGKEVPVTKVDRQLEPEKSVAFKTINHDHGNIVLLMPEKERMSDILFAYVDGSFDKDTNRYSFGAVFLEENKVIQKMTRTGNNPDFVQSYQVAGEALGTLHAIRYGIKHKYKQIVIYYDFAGIEKWANNEWKANKPVSKVYKDGIRRTKDIIELNFKKVKAHSGNHFNEMADSLAYNALFKPEDNLVL